MFIVFLGLTLLVSVTLICYGVASLGYSNEMDKQTKNQLFQLQHQNMRYNRELRILNKKYRRSRLLNKKFQKERDALKGHFGMEASMTVIRALYPEQNLNHLDGE